MTALPVRDRLISPEEYLEGELHSEVKHEYLAGLDAVIPLACIGAELPLAEIYERVAFAAAS